VPKTLSLHNLTESVCRDKSLPRPLSSRSPAQSLTAPVHSDDDQHTAQHDVPPATAAAQGSDPQTTPPQPPAMQVALLSLSPGRIIIRRWTCSGSQNVLLHVLHACQVLTPSARQEESADRSIVVARASSGSSRSSSSSSSSAGGMLQRATGLTHSGAMRAVTAALVAHFGTAAIADAAALSQAAASSSSRMLVLGANSAILQGLQRRQVGDSVNLNRQSVVWCVRTWRLNTICVSARQPRGMVNPSPPAASAAYSSYRCASAIIWLCIMPPQLITLAHGCLRA